MEDKGKHLYVVDYVFNVPGHGDFLCTFEVCMPYPLQFIICKTIFYFQDH